jgi:hypothetical protein
VIVLGQLPCQCLSYCRSFFHGRSLVMETKEETHPRGSVAGGGSEYTRQAGMSRV